MKHILFKTAIGVFSFVAICSLIIFLCLPSNERIESKRIRQQHETFAKRLLEQNIFSDKQMGINEDEIVRLQIESAENRTYNYDILWGEDTLCIKKDSKNSKVYYTLKNPADTSLLNKLKEYIGYDDTYTTHRGSSINGIKEEAKCITNIVDRLMSKEYLCIGKQQSVLLSEVPCLYISQKQLKEWQKQDTLKLNPNESLLDFLKCSPFFHNVPYQFVKMNFREDKLYIGDREEKFSQDSINKQLQLHSMHSLCVLAEEDNIIDWKNRNSVIEEEEPLWISDANLHLMKDFNLRGIGVENKPIKNFDYAKRISLILFIAFASLCILLVVLHFRSSTGGGDGDDIESLRRKIESLEKDKKKLQGQLSDITNLENELSKVTNERNVLNERLGVYKSYKEKSETAEKTAKAWKDKYLAKDKELEDLKKDKAGEIDKAVKEVEKKYQLMEKEYNQIKPYYDKTLEIFKSVKSYYEDIASQTEIRFWDRALFYRVTLLKILQPLMNVWCKNVGISEKIEDIIKNNNLESLEQHMLFYIEKTLSNDNITSEDFLKAVDEKIPQDIAAYNEKLNALGCSKYIINLQSEPTYKSFSELFKVKVTQMKLDDVFKTRLWELVGKEFCVGVEKNTDKAWFFKHVITLAYYASDYLKYAANQSTETIYYYNLHYLRNNFDSKYAREYEHNHYEKSTPYADRIYEWCQDLGISHMNVLVSEYLILP